MNHFIDIQNKKNQAGIATIFAVFDLKTNHKSIPRAYI